MVQRQLQKFLASFKLLSPVGQLFVEHSTRKLAPLPGRIVGVVEWQLREPHFLAGVLDHVVSDERLLLDFAEHHNVDPFDVTRARAALGGPPQDTP